MNTLDNTPAELPPNEEAGHDVCASRPAQESEAYHGEPTAHSGAHPAPAHKPGLPLLGDRAYALRLDRIRLETAALMRHCLARTASGEGDAHEAARCECEAASLELAAACLRDAEGDGTEAGEAGMLTSRHHLQTLAADALDMARHHQGNGSGLPDRPGIALNLHSAAAYRLALAVLAEPHALDNPGQLRLPLAA